MAGRVFRWSVDVLMCAALVSVLAAFAFERGALQSALPVELPASWSALLSRGVEAAGDGDVQRLSRERQAKLRDEFRELEARIDDLETRLFSGLSSVQLWRELADRHQSVSQLACENAGEHLKEIAASQKRDRQRQQRAKARWEKEKAETAAGVVP
ncbi:MAG: hypothetical protein LBM75_11485 [Myxococcales bacterium]|jgi:hypothetical protein|nr:hypothetical protein [Myxococcales bacterium]